MACRIRGPFHGQQGRVDPCCLRHSPGLSRRAGLLSQWAARRWTLIRAGGSRTVECECFNHRGLVQLRTVRECARGYSWATVDYADSRDHRRTAQAGSASLETTTLSSSRTKYGTVEAAWVSSSDSCWQHNPESTLEGGQYERSIGMPKGRFLFVPGFGISPRLTGIGLNVRFFHSACKVSMNCCLNFSFSKSSLSTSLKVFQLIPSMPAVCEPSLSRTC